MSHSSRELRIDRLRVVVHASADVAAAAVADAIAERIEARPDAVLGLATGRTPIGVYDDLARRYARGALSFRRVRTFNLDEYWPIEPDAPGSFRRFMTEHLFGRVDLAEENCRVPDGAVAADDVERECAAHEAAIEAAGGIDLQLLGVGRNGHLAFNEPGAPRDSRTRLVTLTESTRAANREAFAPRDVPRFALTMGLGTILEARRLVALATGVAKARAIERALRGPVGEEVPASWLRTHGDASLHLDRDAAEGLRPLL